VDWRDPKKWFRTLLHKATVAGNQQEVRSLIEEKNANPFVTDSDNTTPCCAAWDEGHEETAVSLSGNVPDRAGLEQV
jgi:hypothetical protein